MTRKLAREYFTLIGILSQSVHGLAYFDRVNLYDNLYTLHKDASKDYISRLLLHGLDFNDQNRQAHTLLETFLKSGSFHLRKYSINHLRLLYRAQLSDFHTWGIQLLVSQLEQPDKDLGLAALSVLEEACEDSNCLQSLIKQKPSFKLVGASGNNLLLMLLSRPEGLYYLQGTQWIESQIKLWRGGGAAIRYVEGLESALVAALNHGDGGPAPGGAYWNQIQRKNRTENDDYYFERVHSLPWTVQLTLESNGSSPVPLHCECFVYSVPIFPAARTAEGDIVPDDESGEEALATYIVALMLDSEGKVRLAAAPMPHVICQCVWFSYARVVLYSPNRFKSLVMECCERRYRSDRAVPYTTPNRSHRFRRYL